MSSFPPLLLLSSLIIALSAASHGALQVDFNRTEAGVDRAPDNQGPFKRYDATHQSASFPTEDYSAFGARILFTPSFPNTSNLNVRQVINRSSASDAAWGTTNLDLLTDWIGCDTRIQNGPYSGSSGTPTYLTLTFEDLPAGNYEWNSYHHDTANIHSDFQVEISTDGGATYTAIAGPNTDNTFSITDSSSGGTPASSQTYDDSTLLADLPSTVQFDFAATLNQPVVIRFAARSTAEADRAFFLINGFRIDLAKDTDGDGLTDTEEASTGTNPALADSDNDGFNDRIEIRESTNPNSAASRPAGLLPLYINEFLASNEREAEDGNEQRNDWIEIANPNNTPVSLLNYHLTDDPENLSKWSFPNISIPANGFLVVFASQNDTPDAQGNPHTNFRLSSDGEFLALVKPDGVSVDDLFSPAYPEQFTDRSYGRDATRNGLFFFAQPTLATVNGPASDGVVQDTNFSRDRALLTNASDSFELAITSGTPGAEIRYTTNGSLPTPSSGIVYTGPINISTTTNIRAIAHLPGTNWIPTNVDTHSYIFVDDVAQQPDLPPGWASDWGFDSQVGQIVTADYGMDQRVVNDDLSLRGPGYSIREALLDIPSVSLTLRQRDIAIAESDKLPNDNISLYGTPRVRNPRKDANGNEIPDNDIILPDGSQGFQEDIIVETHGNSSRTPFRMQKHSLRVSFTTRTGIGKLRYDLFPDSPVDEFNKLVLRACFTDSWALNTWAVARYRPNDSLIMRDVWMKESFGAMGQPTSYGNFVHLYLNGVYFGVHNLTERLEDDWYAEHLGGEEEDWEINDNLQTPGELWQDALNITRSNASTSETFTEASEVIDMENYIDYLILHFYVDAEDWPQANGYAAVNATTGDGKYRFSVWDQEVVLDKFTWNYYDRGRGNTTATYPGALPFLSNLRRNRDFRMLLGDRVYKHLHDGGALTAQNAGARVLEICNRIDKAIVAESARWGDTQSNTPYGNTATSSNDPNNDNYPPLLNNPIYFTREQHWVVERDHLINNHIPILNSSTDSRGLIQELRNLGWYPRTNPPEFSTFGGVVPVNTSLTLTADAGLIFYTLDGSDPRLLGGRINPDAMIFDSANPIELVQTGTITTRARNGTEWSPIRTADFIVGTAAAEGNFVVSEIMYNPAGSDSEIDLEFIELTNISDTALDLSLVTITGDISYEPFPAGFLLAPNSAVVIAQNREAFSANPAYDVSNFVLAPEDFQGSLSNGGGTITVLAQDGSTIQSFDYGDSNDDGWPDTPDGDGPSLVLVDAYGNLNPALPTSWIASSQSGGNPGQVISPFPSNPEADFDNDGFSALAEYFFGTSENIPDTTVASFTETAEGLLFQFGRNPNATGVDRIIEISEDLQSWSDDPSAYTENPPITNSPDGRTYESFTLNTGSIRRFIRVRVIAN